MPANDWIQLGVTIATFLATAIVFYFKNLETIRMEITSSEGRLRSEIGALGSRIEGVRDDVHRLDVTVARLEANEQPLAAGHCRSSRRVARSPVTSDQGARRQA